MLQQQQGRSTRVRKAQYGVGGHLGSPGSLAGWRGRQNEQADPAAGEGLPGGGEQGQAEHSCRAELNNVLEVLRS